MKALRMVAAAALVLAPITAVAAPASAATISGPISQSGPVVASPAGLGSDLANWFCRNYGLAC